MLGNEQDKQSAVAHLKKFFSIYLEKRDFDEVQKMLHPDVSWFGTGAHEICRNYADAVRLLQEEKAAWDGYFKILEEWYEAVPLEKDEWIIYGELKIKEDGINTILLDMDSRFSVVCVKEDGEFWFKHIHFSVANEAQEGEGFVHKKLVENYNSILEHTLKERTAMLKDKTKELQTMADNIYGGIQICDYDEDYTICYASNGFVKLTGYSQEEIESVLQRKHVALIYPPDVAVVKSKLREQLQYDESFSLEYRIVKKDGKMLWVIDRGVYYKTADGQEKVQRILTDITMQKEQEEALRISEKRYEIALQQLNASMFEYNLITHELVLIEKDAQLYQISKVVEKGPEGMIEMGIIDKGSVESYREMYRQIHAGAPFAKCYISTKDAEGILHDYELNVTNIFDQNGNPIRAIGVKKNISQVSRLQREKEYMQTLTADKYIICEADITSDSLLYLDKAWVSDDKNIDDMRYSELADILTAERIAPEHCELVSWKLSSEYITQTYRHGGRLFKFEYRLKTDCGYEWHEATVNIIRDQRKECINIRIYNMQIEERKQKEKKAEEEQKLYETMTANALMAFEVNLSRNMILGSKDNVIKQYQLGNQSDYDSVMGNYNRGRVYEEDNERFQELLSAENLIRVFRRGEREVHYPYRECRRNHEFHWLNCTVHLYEEPETGEIKGFFYMEDIDQKKKEELSLKYMAEHDLMTGLYSKRITEALIEEYLQKETRKDVQHAFLMIDADYFKEVNDTFGHKFGDAVLVDIAEKMRKQFGETHIVGRLGGDEFCVFMKEVSIEHLEGEAKRLCDALYQTYSQDKSMLTVSVSIGAALFPIHGDTLDQLYKSADQSLYSAKKNGRNQFFICTDSGQDVK